MHAFTLTPIIYFKEKLHTQNNVLLNQQKIACPYKSFRLNMGQWRFGLN